MLSADHFNAFDVLKVLFFGGSGGKGSACNMGD